MADVIRGSGDAGCSGCTWRVPDGDFRAHLAEVVRDAVQSAVWQVLVANGTDAEHLDALIDAELKKILETR